MAVWHWGNVNADLLDCQIIYVSGTLRCASNEDTHVHISTMKTWLVYGRTLRREYKWVNNVLMSRTAHNLSCRGKFRVCATQKNATHSQLVSTMIFIGLHIYNNRVRPFDGLALPGNWVFPWESPRKFLCIIKCHTSQSRAYLVVSNEFQTRAVSISPFTIGLYGSLHDYVIT